MTTENIVDYFHTKQNINNVEYVLDNNDIFYDVGFRVMMNQRKNYLIPCHRLKYNGKIKLVYFTDEYISLNKIMGKIDADALKCNIVNLIKAIIEVDSNGFLNTSYIDSRLDYIFLEKDSLSIKMIYLPINILEIEQNKNLVEHCVRNQLINKIQEVYNQGDEQIQKILLTLKDETISLTQIALKYGNLHNGKRGVLKKTNITCNNTSADNNSYDTSTEMRLEQIGGNLVFHISKNEYLIGKNSSRVDGVIPNNNVISRIHCKIVHKDNKYYICDMESSNGTFINGKRIESGELVEIINEDKVKLANMDFNIRNTELDYE